MLQIKKKHQPNNSSNKKLLKNNTQYFKQRNIQIKLLDYKYLIVKKN